MLLTSFSNLTPQEQKMIPEWKFVTKIKSATDDAQREDFLALLSHPVLFEKALGFFNHKSLTESLNKYREQYPELLEMTQTVSSFPSGKDVFAPILLRAYFEHRLPLPKNKKEKK